MEGNPKGLTEKKEEKRIPAYAYLRVSGQGQVNGLGFDRQLETIQSFAKDNGYEIAQVFREEGISGTTDEMDRPAFQAMMVEILRNGAKTVIVEGLDRLAREYRIQETLLIYLASKGVCLISARTGENVTQAIDKDPMRKALVQVQGVFSELEKNLLVRKLRNARDKVRMEKGRCEGILPYGHPDRPEAEQEQETITRIRLLRRRRRGGFKGMTLQEIAARLNQEGIKTPSGKGQWGTTQVRRLLCLSDKSP
ncbi:MAG: recombinase family protein [Candidatus Thorarchaeota archaeon]